MIRFPLFQPTTVIDWAKYKLSKRLARSLSRRLADVTQQQEKVHVYIDCPDSTRVLADLKITRSRSRASLTVRKGTESGLAQTELADLKITLRLCVDVTQQQQEKVHVNIYCPD